MYTTKTQFQEFIRFCEQMSLMHEPFEKAWAQFIDPQRLPLPPAVITINMN